jgi:predicted permease
VRLLAYLGAKDLPRGAAIGIDGTALVFTAAIALLAGIGFGGAPLFHVLRRDLNEVFRGGERSGTAGRAAAWVRSSLVVCQFALAFILLIGSGLLTMSFARLLKVDAGFKADNVTTAQISLPGVRYSDDARARNFLSDLLARLGAIPGVRHVGVTSFLPFSGHGNASVIMVVGHALASGEPPPVPGWNHVNAGYFQAMGIPVLQGRALSESDGPDSPKVVVIDQFLARKYWPRGNPLGAQITRGIEIAGEKEKPDACTVVGVVGSVKTGDLAENNPVGQVYFSYKQYVRRDLHLVLRTDAGSSQTVAAVRRELRRADPEMPLFDVKSMTERLSSSLANRRAAMALCLMFGALALLLAAIGVYGVLAYSVSQRTREIGVRVALGAGARDVVGMVVGHGLRMAAAGLAIGAVGAFAVTRLMSAMLFEIRPSDPAVFLIVAAVLAVVAGIASLIPSARAARIPPAVALRYE